MLLVMPVVDGHAWTTQTVERLDQTASGNVRVLVWDNASVAPYAREQFGQMRLVHRSPINIGYYAPIFDAYEHNEDEIIGLIHNDVFIHESGWDERVDACFREDPKLGAVGFVGSYEVDENGGRGVGTMCHFVSHSPDGRLIGQSQDAGERITDLRPSLVLDSLFMAFRREAISDIMQDAHDLPLAHFYDRIWPLRLVRAGWRVGTLGVEVSHWGGITIVLHPRFQEDCKEWCWTRGVREVPNNDWHLQMYREGERRLLEEFKTPGGLIPSEITRDWRITSTGGAPLIVH